MSSTAYIFGATGFVGTHLAKGLMEAGYPVVALGRRERDRIEGPLREVYRPWQPGSARGQLGIGSDDLVFHLAADLDVRASFEDPEGMIGRNVQLTLEVLGEVRAAGTHPLFVYASSDRVYGDAAGDIDETTVPGPVDPYGASKLAGENIARAFSSSFDIPTIVLRSANLYGPQQRPVQFLPSMCRKILDGADRVTVGNLEGSRNFLFVDDFVQACLCVAARRDACRGFELYNVSGDVHSLQAGCDHLQEIARTRLGREVRFVPDPTLFRPTGASLGQAYTSSAKFQSAFEWKPEVNFRAGLERMLSEGVRQTEDNS